jgi:hypothetical protein
MSFNIFEGFRRIGYAIIAILVLVCLYDFFTNSLSNFYQAINLATAPIGFYVFMKITGWIVRGFFGIPMGKDFKD